MKACTWVVVLTIALSGAGRASAGEAEDPAAKMVEKLGGKIECDESGSIITVDLHAEPVTDADLKTLAPLKGLTTLHLGWTRVTDAGLKNLEPLSKLTSLNLCSTEVTDEGLKSVAVLTRLTFLELFGTKVTGAGLKELRPLAELTMLNLAQRGSRTMG